MSISWLSRFRTPLLVAHRGSSARAPENTLAAFRAAIEDGADGVELDVRLSRDQVVVVCHDALLGRCSTGRGRVSGKTVEELKQYSAGAWFGRQFSSERIPTLAEVFEEVGDRIAINVELKADRFDRTYVLVDRCCEVIRKFRREKSTLVTSFHHAHIRRVRQSLPDLPTGLLLHHFHLLTKTWEKYARGYGVEYLIVGGQSLRKSLVERAHKRGIRVGEFTVLTQRRLQRALRYGTDVVITDDPARMRMYL